MFVATMIAAPGALNENTVHTLCSEWKGRDLRWLADAQAAEFTVTQLPDDRWEKWQALQSQATDLVLQPAEGRRKRLLLADMDSTMIQQECIDELAELAGVGDRVRDITARAMNGALDFDGALIERVALLAGMDAAIIDRVWSERITLMPGGAALLATMTAHGARAALVSGGFTEFTGRVAERLGFHEHRANTLEIAAGKLTGRVIPPILGRAAKVAALEQITARMGISEAQVLAVGDGANDLGMLGRAGTGAALHAKPVVAAECDVRINHGDLTALLFLQGYAKQDFSGDPV